MAKYTTEVRSICETSAGLTSSVGFLDVEMVIKNALPKVFNFDFPIFDEEYRTVLESKILRHFYTREIGEETVGLWKLRLSTKLNEIMPYYNKLYESELIEFNPLYTVNLKNTHSSIGNGVNDIVENIDDKTSNDSINFGNNKNNIKSNDNTTSDNTNINKNNTLNWNMYSDTPQGSIDNIDDNTYLTNATKETNSNESVNKQNNTINNTNNTESDNNYTNNTKNNNKYNRERNNNTKFTNIENYLENVNGYSGKSASELILKYRETFLNIDMLIINELEVLFIQLW